MSYQIPSELYEKINILNILNILNIKCSKCLDSRVLWKVLIFQFLMLIQMKQSNRFIFLCSSYTIS